MRRRNPAGLAMLGVKEGGGMFPRERPERASRLLKSCEGCSALRELCGGGAGARHDPRRCRFGKERSALRTGVPRGGDQGAGNAGE